MYNWQDAMKEWLKATTDQVTDTKDRKMANFSNLKAWKKVIAPCLGYEI